MASALQPVVGEILDVDGARFAEPFKRLARRVPSPANVAERRELKARLAEFTQRMGMDFHAWFHRGEPLSCDFHPVERTAAIWFDADADPRRLLTIWASTYADAFARHHPVPPVWEGFARLLRETCAQPADIQGIARAIGASRKELDDSFWRTFGLTPSAYHRRVRLVHGLSQVRHRGTKVETAAGMAGFASVKNFNRAVRRHTAMTPPQIRHLSRAAFEELDRTRPLRFGCSSSSAGIFSCGFFWRWPPKEGTDVARRDQA